MLRWAVIFLVIALVAALFGFGGIASAAGDREDPVLSVPDRLPGPLFPGLVSCQTALG